VDRADPRHHPRGGRAAVLLVEAVRGPQAQLEEGRAGVAERRHPLARRHLALRALPLLRLLAAAEHEARLLLAQPRHRLAPVLGAAAEGLVLLQPALENGHGRRL
jgi:hypothetical protein